MPTGKEVRENAKTFTNLTGIPSMRTIFYSWQSDTDPSVNQDFIRTALESAASGLTVKCEIDESARGVAGSPPFFATITSKIDRCACFVADLTLVTGTESRKSCNPNVLVEYGYALAKHGERKIITVMNRSFGAPELLPSDIRNIIISALYDLPEGAEESTIRSAHNKLGSDLLQSLRRLLEDPRSTLNISDPEARIAKYILRNSKLGRGTTHHKADEISEALSIELDITNQSLAELVSRGYLQRSGEAGTNSPPVTATPYLYWDLDVYVNGWNPREDAKRVFGKSQKAC